MTTAEEIRARIGVIEITLIALYELRDRRAAERKQATDAAAARRRPAVAADTDIDVEIDPPRMQDVLRGYTRLP